MPFGREVRVVVEPITPPVAEQIGEEPIVETGKEDDGRCPHGYFRRSYVIRTSQGPAHPADHRRCDDCD